MTNKEKEAIEKIEEELSFTEDDTKTIILLWKKTELLEDIIQNQQKEIERKNRQLEEKTNRIKNLEKECQRYFDITTILTEKIEKISENHYNELRVNGILFTGPDIKEYFTNKVEQQQK